MNRHTLFAYVDGSDLEFVAADIESALERFLEAHSWRYAKPQLVNQRHQNDGSLRAGDLPDWDLGLNIDLPDAASEPPRWFSEIERVVAFLASLRSTCGRDFIVGIGDSDRGISEDLFSIDSASPDIAKLRRAIGVRSDAS
jgi:hypothetical protein